MRSAILYAIVGAMATLASASDFAEMGMEMHLAGDLGIVPRATATNLQTFASALGNAPAAPITQSSDSKRPFQVGGSTFPDFKSAFQRSCDDQKNDCAKVANGGKASGLKVSDCDSQREQCVSSAGSVTQTSFPVLTSSNAEFDFFCDP